MIIENEINEVYDKLDTLYRLKAKRQIKGTGIVFKGFLEVKDLIKENEYYVVLINDGVIQFKTQTEFYVQLIEFCKKIERGVKIEIEALEQHKKSDLEFNAVYNDLAIEELFQKESCLHRLNNHIERLRLDLNKKVSEC